MIIRRRLRWGLAAALVLIVAVAATWWMRGRGGPAVPAARGAATAASAAQPAVQLAASDIAIAAPGELVSTLVVSGGLKAVDSAVIKARVAAEVKALSVREGDRVAAGQLIGRLDATEFEWRWRQAEEQAQAAQAQLDIAQRTLDNNKALVDQGFISRTALDTSVSSANGARASLQAARATAELAKKAVRDSEIRAPIAGLVAQRLVQPGERVPVDARLVEIVDLSRIELEAAVAPDEVTALRVGQPARVQIDGLSDSLPAQVARISPSAQPGTRAVMAYLRLQPHPALRQGLFARGSVDLERRRTLLLPATAVRFDQARPYVLAVENGQAQRRDVRLGGRGEVDIGGRSEAAVEILDGLAAGTPVLRGSVGALRSGTRVELPAGGGPAGTASGAAAGGARGVLADTTVRP